MSPGHDAVLHS